MKNKFLKIFLCFAFVVSLAGCNNKSEFDESSDSDKISENKEKIKLIIKNSVDNWSYEDEKLDISDNYDVTVKLYNVGHWYICEDSSINSLKKINSKDSNSLINSIIFNCYDSNMDLVSSVKSNNISESEMKVYDKAGNEINETIEQGKEEFRSLCAKYTYKEVFRKIENYTGKLAQFTGEVIQVLEGDDYFQVMMNVTKDEWGYYDDSIFVQIDKEDFDGRILEDDIITVYGEIGPAYTYETVLGDQNTIPSFEAYIGELVE